MKINLMNMSEVELDILEEKLTKALEEKLRNMKYDDELKKIYAEMELLNIELKRRKEEKDV
jgi:hypothetical protein